jgi:hypothetical protein
MKQYEHYRNENGVYECKATELIAIERLESKIETLTIAISQLEETLRCLQK